MTMQGSASKWLVYWSTKIEWISKSCLKDHYLIIDSLKLSVIVYIDIT